MPERRRNFWLVVLLCAGGSLAVAPRATAWQGDVPLSTAPGDQGITWSRPPGLSLAADGQGGAIVGWEDRAGMSMRLQRLSAGGVALWTQDGVVPAPTGCRQTSPRVVADGSGGAIVTWLEGRPAGCTGFVGGSTLYAQRVDAQGHGLWPAGGIAVAGTGSSTASRVELASDAAGGAYVLWVGGPTVAGVRAQRIDGAGNLLWGANGVLLGTSASSSGDPRAVADAAGGLLAAWNQEPADPVHGQVMLAVQRITAQGAALWTAGGVLVAPGTRMGLVSDGSGGAIVSFRYDVPGEQTRFEARAQRVGANGTVLWTSGSVSLAPEPAGDLQYPPYQLHPDLVGDGAGGAIVAWSDERDHGMDEDIYAQRVGPDGNPLWPLSGVAIARGPATQNHMRLASDGAGGALIVWPNSWHSDMDLYAQRIDPSGQIHWGADGIPVSAAPGNQGADYGSDVTPGFALEVVAPGEAIALWPDGRNGPCFPSSIASCDVYAQQVRAGVQVPALPLVARAALTALVAASAYRAVSRRGRALPSATC